MDGCLSQRVNVLSEENGLEGVNYRNKRNISSDGIPSAHQYSSHTFKDEQLIRTQRVSNLPIVLSYLLRQEMGAKKGTEPALLIGSALLALSI